MTGEELMQRMTRDHGYRWAQVDTPYHSTGSDYVTVQVHEPIDQPARVKFVWDVSRCASEEFVGGPPCDTEAMARHQLRLLSFLVPDAAGPLFEAIEADRVRRDEWEGDPGELSPDVRVEARGGTVIYTSGARVVLDFVPLGSEGEVASPRESGGEPTNPGEGGVTFNDSLTVTSADERAAHGLNAGRYSLNWQAECEVPYITITPAAGGDPVYSITPMIQFTLVNSIPSGVYFVDLEGSDCGDWSIALSRI